MIIFAMQNYNTTLKDTTMKGINYLAAFIGGGGGTAVNIQCYLGTIVLAVVGSFIGWKVGSELKKAGKLK